MTAPTADSRIARSSHLVLLLFLLPAFLLMAGCGNESRDPANAPRSTEELRPSADQPITPLEDPFEIPPDLTVTTTDGETINLGAREGGVQILNFWATWCAPCLQEIPDLNRLHAEYDTSEVQIIGIANRQGPSEVLPFAERHDISYPVVADSAGALDEQLGPIYVLPTTLIVQADGRVTHQVTGIFPAETFSENIAAYRSSP